MTIIGILGKAGSGKDTAGQLLVQEFPAYAMALADPLKIFCRQMFDWSVDQLWGPSELRNAEDKSLPFVRCPSCHEVYSRHLLGTFSDSTVCDNCGAVRAPEEWQSFLSPRFALQHLGTEWARNFSPGCHINYGLMRAQAVLTTGNSDADPLWRSLPNKVLNQRYRPQVCATTTVYISDVRFHNEVRAILDCGGAVYRIKRGTEKVGVVSGITGHASEAEQDTIPDSALTGVIDNNGTIADLNAQLQTITGTTGDH